MLPAPMLAQYHVLPCVLKARSYYCMHRYGAVADKGGFFVFSFSEALDHKAYEKSPAMNGMLFVGFEA